MRRAAIGLVIALVLVRPAAAAAEDPPPTVSAAGEVLEGVWLAPSEAVFRGIPYAAAPVGDLRWRPPAPHRPRARTQSARAFGPVCVQDDRLVVWVKLIAAAFGTEDKLEPAPLTTSEDCLFLNVWTTSLKARRPAPVMLWIHGGSNVNGEGSSSWTDGSALARMGVVVVTINYRLGVFGFLAHAGLSTESPHHVSGNYGLLDQLAALRWVKANIRAFGGDPDRVTVFGESAGATDLLALMSSPAAKGLFHRAIAQSGASVFVTDRLAQAEAQGTRLAEAARAVTAAELRRKPAGELLEIADRLRAEGKLNLGPIVDGWLLTDVPSRVFIAGGQRRVPLLIGSTALEMTTLRGLLPRIDRTVPAYRQWLAQAAGPGAVRLEEIYPASADAQVEDALIGVMTDYVFTCTSRLTARAVARAGGSAYLYQFTRVPPGGRSLGAYHGLDVTYAFGVHLPWLPREAADDELSAAMRRYWVAFAESGRPSVAGLPDWPVHDSDSDRYLELGPTIATHAGLRKAACDILDQRYPLIWDGAR